MLVNSADSHVLEPGLERARRLGFRDFMVPATPPTDRPYNSAD
jgi:hypothetical protein